MAEEPSADLLDLVENLRAYIRLVYPEDMTPQAKRILEHILDSHERKMPT